MLVGRHGGAWHQHGAAKHVANLGRWKIEFVEDGEYNISLRRFPRESGLAINATFPGLEKTIQDDRPMPASTKTDFEKGYLYVANVEGTKEILPDQEEVTFSGFVPAGKYDMEAMLIDKEGQLFPAYYLYVEKI